MSMVLAACGPGAATAPAATQDPGAAVPSERPGLAAQTPTSDDAQVTITTTTGLVATFDVTSCTSPGSKIVNLQASGPDGDLDLRASVQGGFRVSGATSIEAQVDEIEVAEDGSVTASGTLTAADAPDVQVPFQLVASPGSCP